jgi:hypothetical protein
VLKSDSAKRLAAPVRAKKSHGLYAAAWALSGLIAGGYVFTLLVRQDSGAALALRSEDVTKTQADVAQLQRTVGLLETDVARIKIDAAQQDEREKQMAQRVATVETRIEQFTTQVIAAAPQPTPPANARTAKAAPPPAPAAAPPAARITTSTITPPAQPAAPAPQRELATARQTTAAPATDETKEPAAAVLLARGPSLDALRLSWNLLNERHKQTLGGFQPRVVEVEPGSYQLVAGPVANPAEAMKVCASLKSRGVACQAADFKGNAL